MGERGASQLVGVTYRLLMMANLVKDGCLCGGGVQGKHLDSPESGWVRVQIEGVEKVKKNVRY